MEIGSMRINQADAYGKVDAAALKAEAKEAEGAALAEESEAASFTADGGRTYDLSALKPKTYTPDTEMIERLRSELEQRMSNLVKQMLGQQIDKDQMWEKLRTGQFTATKEEIEQAQRDIADDGYWGVEQVSDRLVQYATALTGGDPDQLDTMIEAFEKGYAQAEKTWGSTLPELSQRTREATLKKFQDLKDKYAREAAGGATGDVATQTLLEESVQNAMSGKVNEAASAAEAAREGRQIQPILL